MLEQHLEKLRIFYALAQTGSMVQASRKLAISQPAISKCLSNLEGVIDQPLMVRSRQGMRLTPTGEKLFQFCEMLFAKLEDLEKSLESFDSVSGVLQIGTYETFFETIWPTLLGQLAKQYPDLDIQVKTDATSNLWQALENGSIDLIVDAEPQTSQQFYSQVIFEDHFELYQKKGAKLKVDSKQRLPLAYATSAIDRSGKNIEDTLNQMGIKHRLAYDVQSFTFVRALALKGLCVGVLPARLAHPHLKSGELESYLRNGKPISFGRHRICATYPEHLKKNPRISAVTKTMVEMLRNAKTSS
jgi:molybdate transport repressor ModE-like protein